MIYIRNIKSKIVTGANQLDYNVSIHEQVHVFNNEELDRLGITKDDISNLSEPLPEVNDLVLYKDKAVDIVVRIIGGDVRIIDTTDGQWQDFNMKMFNTYFKVIGKANENHPNYVK